MRRLSRPAAAAAAAAIAALAAAAVPLAAPAGATLRGPVAATSRIVEGPYGVRLRAPARETSCGAGGVLRVAVSARWSRRALLRPVRSIRVLLQRPGSENVVDAVVFAPARASTTRHAVLTLSACRPNLDVRYELFVGRIDVPHDHQSVVFRTHGA